MAGTVSLNLPEKDSLRADPRGEGERHPRLVPRLPLRKGGVVALEDPVIRKTRSKSCGAGSTTRQGDVAGSKGRRWMGERVHPPSKYPATD